MSGDGRSWTARSIPVLVSDAPAPLQSGSLLRHGYAGEGHNQRRFQDQVSVVQSHLKHHLGGALRQRYQNSRKYKEQVKKMKNDKY